MKVADLELYISCPNLEVGDLVCEINGWINYIPINHKYRQEIGKIMANYTSQPEGENCMIHSHLTILKF